MAPTERRVLGLPASWFGTLAAPDPRALRHPIAWARWRAQVRRLGPYAPAFGERPGRRAPPS